MRSRSFCFVLIILSAQLVLASDVRSLERAPEVAGAPACDPSGTTYEVHNLDELYTTVNLPSFQANPWPIYIFPGTYVLSVNDPSGNARPNGGRLELQPNMALCGVPGNRAAVTIDASGLPAASYAGSTSNSGAIRLGNGDNSVNWITVRNAVNGGTQMIVHRSTPGTSRVRIAHTASTGGQRGIDIRNVAASQPGFHIVAEILDNDLFGNRTLTATGIRIINSQGAAGNSVTVSLSGNRMFDNQQGMIVENLGSTNGGIVSVSSVGDRFYENGGGATVGAAFGPTNNSTVNFTATNSVFENNLGATDFYRGGLNVAGGLSFMTANGGSNNTANVVLRNCRFANNQNTDLGVFGATSLPVTIGPAGSNNRAHVSLYGTSVGTSLLADSDPPNPAGLNRAAMSRNALPRSDFDGDGRADRSVFRQADLYWYLDQTQSGFRTNQFGLATDRIVPADYDGDGKTDVTIYRNGQWWRINSSDGLVSVFNFGLAGDIPQPADYTGDGRAELCIFRNGAWWTLDLTNNTVSVRQFGASGDWPVAADYDGDGKTDIAVHRVNDAFYINRSSLGELKVNALNENDLAVIGDYDGDGKADVASIVFTSPVQWTVVPSDASRPRYSFLWGLPMDVMVPADYDGDGRTDPAIYRNGIWWTNGTRFGVSILAFGLAGDIPIPSSYIYSDGKVGPSF